MNHFYLPQQSAEVRGQMIKFFFFSGQTQSDRAVSWKRHLYNHTAGNTYGFTWNTFTSTPAEGSVIHCLPECLWSGSPTALVGGTVPWQRRSGWQTGSGCVLFLGHPAERRCSRHHMLEAKTHTHQFWQHATRECVCVCVCIITTHAHTLLPAGCVSRHTGHITDLWPRPCTHTVHSARHTAAAASPTHCSRTANTPRLATRGYHSNQQNTCRITGQSVWCHFL